MRKVLSVLSKTVFIVLFVIVEFILLFTNASLWIHLEPPASALLTVPKLVYPNIANKAVIVYAVLIIIIAAALVFNYKRAIFHSTFSKSVLIVFLVTLIVSLTSSLTYIGVINNTKTEYAIKFPKIEKGIIQTRYSRQSRTCTDLSAEFRDTKPTVFKLYMPDNSQTPRDIVLYLAYGNWLAVDEKNVDYLVDGLTQKGYGAAVFTGKTRRDTDIVGIIQDIRAKIAYLKNHAAEYNIRHIYLSGGSAGGNLALLTSYAANCPDYASDGLTPEQTKVDGVIAFYPVVDMTYNYYYFSGKTADQESPLDKLGDWFFSLSDVNGTKSISDSNKAVMQTLLGGGPEDNTLKHLYEISSPASFLSPDVPPTLLIQGEHDSMNPFEPTKKMYENLKNAGADAALLALPFTDHAFDMVMPEGSVVTAKTLGSITEWLDLHHSI